MKLTLERQVYFAFIFALILLLTLGYFGYRSANSVTKALWWENHSQEVFLQLDDLFKLTLDAETSGRGFIITGRDDFLERYNLATPMIKERLSSLRQLVSDNPQQTAELGKLENLIAEKLEFIKDSNEVRRNQGLEAAIKRTESGTGKRIMDEIRLSIGRMRDAEKVLLGRREKNLNDSIANALLVLFFGTGAGIVSLGLANFAIFREFGKRRTAENSLLEANKNLEKRVAERTGEISQKNEDLQTEISKREKAEIILRTSEEFNRSIFENSPDCVNVLELDGTLHSMNKNGLCIMEIDDFDSFAGKQWVDFWEGDENELAFQAVESARKGKTANFEGFCKSAKGTLRYWTVSVAPIFDADRKPSRLISTSRDTTERREAESERETLLTNEKAARNEAEIANRMRDEFLATVSHELRAPLNSILGWGRMLEKGKLDELHSQKAVHTIVRNAEAQNRLIEDLLDVSRIISGKLRLEVMTIKPIIFVESALETVRPAAEAKDITLEIIEDSVVSHISGDPHRLQQVIWNLLSNAIKFTPNGGKVTIEIVRMNGQIDIRIKDTGVGISQEFLPHVFDRFRQADASSIRKFGGLGLGLAIVRHIAEMHGGTVSVFSEGENQGSTFIISLPVTVSPREDAASNEIKAAMSETEAQFSLDGLLILVVDDEEDTRQLLVQTLTHYGATVVTAKSASEGLSELQEKNPDVLVSDIGMPDEDGYSLIRKIRALSDEQQKNTTAIALTAFTRAQDRMRALAAGFQNHVGKPVEPDELATVIASLTGRLQMDGED